MRIKDLMKEIHENAIYKGFYDQISETLASQTGEKHRFLKNLFICQQLLLITSEIGEATEGLRKGHIPNFKEELADTVIRILDLSEYLGIDLEYEMRKKMKINKDRQYLHNKKF